MRTSYIWLKRLVPALVLMLLFGWHLWSAAKQDRKDGALIEAIQSNNLTKIKACLEEGANPSARDIRTGAFSWNDYWTDITNYRTRYTAMQVALNRGDANFSTIKLLMKYGADINARDSDGVTLLHRCCEQQQGELARYLLDRGADVNIAERHGDTTLMWAIGQNRVELETLLLDRGARVNVCSNTGETPLMRAIENYDLGSLILLANRGADVNAADREGNTPLMRAAIRQLLEAMRFLLDRGAKINAKNRAGETALMIAVENGNYDSAVLLLQKGADANVKDRHRQTVLYRLENAYSDPHTKANLTVLLKKHGARSEGGDLYIRPHPPYYID